MTSQTHRSNVQQTNTRTISITHAFLRAVTVSTVANLALYFLAGVLYSEVRRWEGSSSAQIIGANMVYLLIGLAVWLIVRRYASNPVRTYGWLAAVGFMGSLFLPIGAGFGFGPPGVPAAGVATVITLSLMHVISYAISVPLFLRTVK